MANYQSKYTGAEIDEGIAKASEAVLTANAANTLAETAKTAADRANSHFPMYMHCVNFTSNESSQYIFGISFSFVSTQKEPFTDIRTLTEYLKKEGESGNSTDTELFEASGLIIYPELGLNDFSLTSICTVDTLFLTFINEYENVGVNGTTIVWSQYFTGASSSSSNQAGYIDFVERSHFSIETFKINIADSVTEIK